MWKHWIAPVWSTEAKTKGKKTTSCSRMPTAIRCHSQTLQLHTSVSYRNTWNFHAKFWYDLKIYLVHLQVHYFSEIIPYLSSFRAPKWAPKILLDPNNFYTMIISALRWLKWANFCRNQTIINNFNPLGSWIKIICHRFWCPSINLPHHWPIIPWTPASSQGSRFWKGKNLKLSQKSSDFCSNKGRETQILCFTK